MGTARVKRLLLPIGIAVLLIAYLGPSSYRKYQMDREVDRLCLESGGQKIFEKIFLSPSEFNQWGDPVSVVRRSMDGKSPYVLKNLSKQESRRGETATGEPVLNRFHYQVIRVLDGKILGESISYGRFGGDPSHPFHPTSYSGCIESWNDKSLLRSVFIPKVGGP